MANNSRTYRNNDQSNSDQWKSAGFLNFYLPNKAGDGQRKLGAIGLKLSDPDEKALFDFFTKHGDKAVEVLARKLKVEFRSAERDPAKGFDLGSLEKELATGTNG